MLQRDPGDRVVTMSSVLSSAFVTVLRQVQVPLIALFLFSGCAAKLLRALRARSLRAVLDATELFPARFRLPTAIAVCVAEMALGAALIATLHPGNDAADAAADGARIAATLFFVIATTALLELRERQPGAGCGCFGDLSTAPVGIRQILRAGLFGLAALASVGAQPPRRPTAGPVAFADLGVVLAELLLFAALSPEISPLLARLGYPAPCEIRTVPAGRVLTWLRRSRAWRRHSGMITSDNPADMWRELCWWYAVYPGRDRGLPVDVVFAVRISAHRPGVRAVIVPAAPDAAGPSPGLRHGSPLPISSDL